MQCSSYFSCVSEMKKIINLLEIGTPVTKFSWKKRTERKTLAIRCETRQVIWTDTVITTKNIQYEGTVDWAEIKEIRLGNIFRVCEKEFENSQCFVIFYGSEFNLRILSVAGSNISKNVMFFI